MKVHKPSPSFAPFKPEAKLLLGAGPSMVDPRVLAACAKTTLSHLDPAYIHLTHNMQELLRYVFQTSNRLTIPVAGTGSAAMETAFANMVEPGAGVLVFSNGYFGERMALMAQKYGGDVHVVRAEWGEVFSLDEIEAAIRLHRPKVTVIVHAETSTGVAQPMQGIGDIVHANDGYLIVDAVTSLAGMPLLVDEWGIDICYSATQKCLGAPPGLGPITVNDRALEFIHHRANSIATWYFDLALTDKSWGEARSYPHTAPVNAVYGLYEALRLLSEESLEGCWQRHLSNTERLRAGLDDLGLTLFVSDSELRLPMVTSIRVPDGYSADEIRRQVAAGYGIEIAGGLGPLKGQILRIGLMGYASQLEHVERVLAALKAVL
jgi:alanine-glyoxylate transaminase/serine-glyoxylate transaminase/serine-pyruvate transaminase